jgi:site-specific DNA-methyltransferase (cytosine-N4-specific)
MFFIEFLTEPTDTVLDIFAGSNTTGAAAESLQRRWIAFEQNLSYLSASAFRFVSANESIEQISILFEKLLARNETINLHTF